jgi:hypothetical protein
MLGEALQQVAEEEHGYAEARRGMLADLRKGFNLGTKGCPIGPPAARLAARLSLTDGALALLERNTS